MSSAFRHFTYVTTHSPTLPSLYLRHSSFSKPSAALPTSQFIFQPFFRFSYVTRELILQTFHHFKYVTANSPTIVSLLLRHSCAHSPTFPSLHLRHSSFPSPSVTLLTHSSFSNPSFAFPTSQALHLRRLASRPRFT